MLGPAKQAKSQVVSRLKKKRVITAARKEQNRIAQKAYRQRRKQSGQKPQTAPTRLPKLHPRVNDDITGDINSVVPSQVDLEANKTAGRPPDLLVSSDNVVMNPDALRATLHIDTKYDAKLWPGISSDWISSKEDSAQASPDKSDDHVRYKDTSGETFEATASRGQADCLATCFPSPQANALEFLPTTLFGALLHNALSLGFDLPSISSCGPNFYMSPFYCPTATAQDDPQLLISSATSSINRRANVVPKDLLPTLAQILIPHHASLDLIPFPQFRDRVIILSAAVPHMFNLTELKLDIYTRGALTVRSSRVAKSQPWDPQSWVASPWFLAKWSMAANMDRSCEAERWTSSGRSLR